MRHHALGAAVAIGVASFAGLGAAAASPTAGTARADAGTCKAGFELAPTNNARRLAHDHNGNGFVCVKHNPGTGRNAVKDDTL